jgi:hypothetical protein
MDIALTDAERMLMLWLAKEEESQYGECYGDTLDSLIEKGLAQVRENSGLDNSFIAKGQDRMYWAVSLTDRGRERVRNINEA